MLDMQSRRMPLRVAHLLCLLVAGSSNYDPEDSKAEHASIAIDFAEDGDMDAALISFRAATKFTPGETMNWFNLGTALADEAVDRGDEKSSAGFEEARECFLKSIELDPENGEAMESYAEHR
jgi:tetratricopeptide (TPR) repeat protein